MAGTLPPRPPAAEGLGAPRVCALPEEGTSPTREGSTLMASAPGSVRFGVRVSAWIRGAHIQAGARRGLGR